MSKIIRIVSNRWKRKRARDGSSRRIPTSLPFLATVHGGRSTSRITSPHPGNHYVQGKADQRISNKHCCPAPFPAHIYWQGRSWRWASAACLSATDHPSLLLCPQSLTSARGYWPAHRFMSRNLLKRPSAFPDFYFRHLCHPLRPTVPSLSATSTSALSAS